MKRQIFIAVPLLLLLFLAACTTNPSTNQEYEDVEITVFKSASCGCCVQWSNYMEDNGFKVNTVVLEDLSSIKEQYAIPRSMESCHTAIIGDYFVEGHVPVDVIYDLLDEQPMIDGIALPRMPSGSPGMPGPKIETWQIYSLKNGEIHNYKEV